MAGIERGTPVVVKSAFGDASNATTGVVKSASFQVV